MLTLIHEFINNFPESLSEWFNHVVNCLKCFSFYGTCLGVLFYSMLFGFNPLLLLYPPLVSLTCEILQKLTFTL